jgi:serine O-acetyltransferase
MQNTESLIEGCYEPQNGENAPQILQKQDKYNVPSADEFSDTLGGQYGQILISQLHNWWRDFDSERIQAAIPKAMKIMEENYTSMPSKRFCDNGKMIFSPYHSVTWSIFLYRVARILNNQSFEREADVVYYLNKIMHSVDWYHGIDLPVHFMAEHPLGSVLGRAEYNDYLFVYQGTTVGGNRKNGKLFYPHLGNNVVLYANSTVLGDTKIGDNVIVSANSYLINETVPSNSIVFGQSPHIVVKQKDEKAIREMTASFWMN